MLFRPPHVNLHTHIAIHLFKSADLAQRSVGLSKAFEEP